MAINGRVIHFTKFNKLFFILSAAAIVVLAGLTTARGGFNFSIDFSSGVIFTVVADEDARGIEEQVNPLFEKPVQVQTLGNSGLFSSQRFSLKLVSESENVADFEKQARVKIAGLNGITIEASDLVSPTQSVYLRFQTWILTFFVLVLILLYIWYRFQLHYAFAAILALIHDSLILLGVIGAFQLDFSSTTIAAILTVIGYSLNDTIVVFDRMRENRMTMHTSNLQDIIDYSVTGTLSRTLITSLTTLLAVLAIYFFAYGSVQLFALELIVGIVVGTYSSIYIASSLVLFFDLRHRRKLEFGRGKESKGPKGLKGSRQKSSKKTAGNSSGNLSVIQGGKSAEQAKQGGQSNLASPSNQAKQTADEIRLATEAKRRKRESRRKKK